MGRLMGSMTGEAVIDGLMFRGLRGEAGNVLVAAVAELRNLRLKIAARPAMGVMAVGTVSARHRLVGGHRGRGVRGVAVRTGRARRLLQQRRLCG